MAPRHGRPIDDLDDVRAVFASGRGSFWEYMDCVEVCKDLGDWPLRHQAAELATGEALRGRGIPPPALIEAAQQVVNAILRNAMTIEELEPCVPDAREWFTEHDHYFRARPDDRGQSISRFLDAVHVDGQATATDRKSLYRLVLLANDPDPQSRVRLSSTLRSPFDRSDLAIEAATRALDQEPLNVFALTTRGAAHVDVDELAAAEVDLDAALSIDGDDAPAHVARSRCHQSCGEAAKALQVVKRALDLDPENRFAKSRAMAAAIFAGDEEFFKEVRQSLGSGMPNEGTSDPFVELLAIEAILEGGKIERAEAALTELENRNPRGLSTTRVRKLRRNIVTQKRRQQGRLSL